ncbi:MAG: hypothetical protein Q9164_001826 [Protoblastenia rupestris]
MVSFWPWKGDDTSPASFEKTLSALSAKISKTSSRLDGTWQRSRRLNVLWTLYAGFAYLLYSIILLLVVGWRKWGIVEYGAIGAGPVVIYLVRLTLTTYYDYRTSAIQAQLDDLEKHRNQTIEKLKTATKYNSTQELLKKYGGTSAPKENSAQNPKGKGAPNQGANDTARGPRTPFTPPPTANIPGRIHAPHPQGTPPQIPHQQAPSPISHSPPSWQRPTSPQEPSADFAPNAFSAPPQYAQPNEGPRWYDRIMDVLLGEDESLPGKRLALICSNCRLVNGQAPPGVKRMEDVGKWRCAGCGTMNGEENEVQKLVAGIKHRASDEKSGQKEENVTEEAHAKAAKDEGDESDVTQYSGEEEEEEESEKKPVAEAETPRRRSTRAKKKKEEEGEDGA